MSWHYVRFSKEARRVLEEARQRAAEARRPVRIADYLAAADALDVPPSEDGGEPEVDRRIVEAAAKASRFRNAREVTPEDIIAGARQLFEEG